MTRQRLAMAAAIVAALLPAISVLMDVVGNPAALRWRDDPISRFDRHMAALRETVRGEHMVGYLPPPEVVDRTAHLYAVRYALAPVQVRDSVDETLVVADGVSDPTRLPPQLRIRRDFGDGLLLLERVRP